ncbi:N-acetyltransferase ESCO1 isoform X1 [Pristis pectinata]|uniref:N-acetyltransferase ESCO1 isoform X1 n=1 Tax=Pristis pectinata TaxID=685728 RepID=UPI00223CE428|nr:N-acetyltransferase ESCO1 isoform X1 [Pristis pectinata]
MATQKRKVAPSPASAQRGSVRTKNGSTGGGPSAKKKRLEEKVTSPQLRFIKQSAAQPRKVSSNKGASKSLRTTVRTNRLTSKLTTKLKGKETKVTKKNERMIPLKKCTKPLLKNNASLKSSHQKKSIVPPISKKKSGRVKAERKSTRKQNSAKVVCKQIPVTVSQKLLQRNRTSQLRLAHKGLPNSKKTCSKKLLKMSSHNSRTKAPQKISKPLSKKCKTSSLRAATKKLHQSKKNVKVQSKSTVNVSRMKPAKKDVKSLSLTVRTSKKQPVKKTAKKVTSKSNHTKQLSSNKNNRTVEKKVSSKKISMKIETSANSVKKLQQKKIMRSERLRPHLVSEDKLEAAAVRPQTRSIQNRSKENIQQVVDSKLKSGTKQMLNEGQTRFSQRLNLNPRLSTRSFLSTDSASSVVPTQKKAIKRTFSDLHPKSPENKCRSKKILKLDSKLARTKQENIIKSPKKKASKVTEKVHGKIGRKAPVRKAANRKDSNDAGSTARERKSELGVPKNIPISEASAASETSQEQTKTGKSVSRSKTKIKRTASCATLESNAKLKGLVQNLAKATNCSIKAIKGKTGVETSTKKKQNKILNNGTENKKKISTSIKEQSSKQPHTIHKANKNTISSPKTAMKVPCLQTDDNAKCKRQSILELCEEIAEEIASDTLDLSTKEESTKIEDKTIQEEPEAIMPEDTEKTQRTKSIYSSLNRFQFSGQKCVKRKSIEHHKSVATKYTSQKGGKSWTKIKQIKADQKKLTTVNSTYNKLRNLQVRQAVSQVVVQTIKVKKEKLSNGVPVQTKEENDIAYDQHKAKTFFPHLEVGRDINNGQRSTENSISEKIKLAKLCDQKEDEAEVAKIETESEADESFRLHLESSPECSPEKSCITTLLLKPVKEQVENESGSLLKETVRTLFTNPDSSEMNNESVSLSNQLTIAKNTAIAPEISVQREAKLSDNADGGGLQQTNLDSGQKRIGAISCTTCGMLYAASIPEDEAQHFKFHKHFISAVKYVGWKKERILGEYPDGKIIMVLPDDPKYALKKVEEIREMVDNDLGFQQAELKCPSRTKTLLFISNDRKIVGCLIAEHIQRGFRVIEDKATQQSSNDAIMLERQRAWCCSTNPEPAICGISRVWVFSMMRRKAIATRMTDCLRSNFVYGSYLSKDEIAFSDPTPDGKLFATRYCGTPRFLVYNFVS